jgi:hypothetical protein
MQDRLVTADILPVVKEIAIRNLLNTKVEDLLFIIMVLGAAIFGLLLFRKLFLGNSFKLNELSLPSFFIIVYIILMSFPSVLWFYGSTKPFRYTYFLAIQSVLIFLPIGVLLANTLFLNISAPSRVINNFLSSRLSKTKHDLFAYPAWVLIFVASGIFVLYYMLTSRYVPLIGALVSYGEVSGDIVRRSIFWEGPLIHYGHALFARFLLPFCLLYAYFMACIYKPIWKYIFWFTFFWVMIFSFLTFDRVYPFSIVIFLILAIYFKNNSKQLVPISNPKSLSKIYLFLKAKIRTSLTVLALFVFSMVVGGLITITQWNRSLSLVAILKTSMNFFVDRVLLDSSYMAFIYFEEFSSSALFLYGKSVHPILSYLFGMEFYPTISPSFIAELWLNFGWAGVIIGTVFIGFILQLLQLWLFRKKSIPILCLYILLLLNGAWIIYGHILATMVVSVYLLSLPFLLILNRKNI